MQNQMSKKTDRMKRAPEHGHFGAALRLEQGPFLWTRRNQNHQMSKIFTMNDEGIGAQLRFFRRKMALAQAGLAERAGIDRKTVIALERGRGTTASLFRAIEVLDLRLDIVPTKRRLPTFDQMIAENLAEDERARAELLKARRKSVRST